MSYDVAVVKKKGILYLFDVLHAIICNLMLLYITTCYYLIKRNKKKASEVFFIHILQLKLLRFKEFS